MIMADAYRKGFLIDLEGVLLERGLPAPGAVELVQRLQLAHQPHRFISDQRYGAPRELALRLRRSGLRLEEGRIFTAASATARFLARQEPGGTVFVLGDGGLVQALLRNGFALDDRSPDYVVVAEGDALSLSLLQRAVNLVRGGAKRRHARRHRAWLGRDCFGARNSHRAQGALARTDEPDVGV